MTVAWEAAARPPDASGLPRPRLVAPFLESDDTRTVLVVAPAGSGKTTLLSRAATLAPRRTAWLTLAPEDRQPPAFRAHLLRALSPALAADLTEAEPASMAMLLDDLTAAAGTTPPPVLVVLDDVHEIDGSDSEAELVTLVRRRPRWVRLGLGSRRPVGCLNVPRMLVSDEALELDAEQLRFRSWEVEELFRMVYDEPLSPEAAAALTRRTGGWAAGLTLFHLATAGKSQGERERAISGLGGRSRLLRSYLTRTVLAELDADRRTFLLHTSTLRTLTGPLCDALLGRQDSALVLQDLADRQFFTMAADDGRTFRYHHVMQTLLEGLLRDELGQVSAARVYARSAVLLEAAGLTAEAARAYALAEDPASVARLLHHAEAGPALEALDVGALSDDDPWLALARARRLQRAGALPQAEAAFREAALLLDDAEFRERCARGRFAVRLWTGEAARVPRAASEWRTRPWPEALRALTISVAGREPHPHPLVEGVHRLLSGDAPGAAASLARVAEEPPEIRLLADLAAAVADLAGSAPDTLAPSEAGAGSLLARLERLVLSADLLDQPWVARVARGLQAAALLAGAGEEWRAGSCASLVQECAESGDDWGALLLRAAWGLALELRESEGAVTVLADAAADAQRLQAPVPAVWVTGLRALAALRADDPLADRLEQESRRLGRTCGLPGGVTPYLTPRLHRHVPVAAATAVLARPPAPDPSLAAAEVVVRCLGGFELSLQGRAVDLGPLRPLPRELLMMLALRHGTDVHREVLIDTLWPDASVDSAVHRLHAATSTVRRHLAASGLGADTVQRHGSAYRLWLGERVAVDVAAFERAVHEAQHAGPPGPHLDWSRRALEHYAGDLLPEAGPAEWVVPERERLRLAAAGVAHNAAARALDRQDLGSALGFARRAVDLDPLRDTSWELLEGVQSRMGDTRAAEATRARRLQVTGQLAAPALQGAPRRGAPRGQA